MSTQPETMDTQSWRELDHAHHIHPFTDHAQMHSVGTRIITRAEGIYLWDSDGNRLLDAMAGLWCVNVGYGRHELAEAAAAQMQNLPYYNTFFQTSHPPVIELSRLLAEVMPEGLGHFFFVNSGSEANDTIVRMVRHYWATKDKPERSVIISRGNAYHGSTVASASLGGMQVMHNQGGLPIPDVSHIPQPYWFGESMHGDPDEFGLERARELEKRIQAYGPERVAAFIAEPVQGAGGVIIPPDSYWPEIQRICREYDVLLVADEVICGFGRTGKWFGCDTYNIKPDIVPIAKGLSSGYLPIGAVAVNDEIFATLTSEASAAFAHGFTYSGHPACAAVAIRNIQILRDEKLVERVGDDTSHYLKEKWSKLIDHPLVGEARSVGLLGALELVVEGTEYQRHKPEQGVGVICRDHAIANGLVMRAVGDTMVISPPLIIDHAEIDELIERVWRTLDQTQKKIG